MFILEKYFLIIFSNPVGGLLKTRWLIFLLKIKEK